MFLLSPRNYHDDMDGPVSILVTVLAAYLVGAIPFGYLVARARGVDITALGSGNIGATNVGRVLGKRLGILVFVLDFAKGTLPAGVARYLAGSAEDAVPVAAALAAVLGHMFPVYLHFKGGKGVATGAGVVFVLLPLPALGALLTWIALVSASGYVSLASLGAAAMLCLGRVFAASAPFGSEHWILTAFCFLAAGLVVVRHHANIGRLFRGTENRLPETATMLSFTKTVHVLSLGLWFGTVVFFTFVVGLVLLGTFDRLTQQTTDRPVWLPAPAGFEKELESPQFPKPLAKEQGRRLFGAAVGALFPWYFGIQTVCAVLALATAWPWGNRPAAKVHRVRRLILAGALLTVGVSWWLDWEVNCRGEKRTQASDAVLVALRDRSSAPSNLVQEADAARAAFQRWHNYSLLANFATLLLVTVGMALTAHLPAGPPPEEPKGELGASPGEPGA
jgi:acyl-phosphate glycerol 3-phosphate acyltransferase